MRQKVLWIDLETTGTNSAIHAIVQLAALVEIDNEIVEEIDLRMRPMSKHEIDPEALEKNGLEEDEIITWEHPSVQYERFLTFIERYINRYEKTDKFILAGYNINAFDEPFLRQMFVDNAKTRKERKYGGYFGSWFFWPKRDVQTYVAEHIVGHSLRLENYKLETICKRYGIPIEAHNALSDVHATRTLYRVLRYSMQTLTKAA